MKIEGSTIYDTENGKAGIRLKNLAFSIEKEYMIEKRGEDEWPFQTQTGTTEMVDWIGNITEMHGDKCSVKGVYRGFMQELMNITMCLPKELRKKGERVMVTEHLNVDGRMDFLATKHRILFGTRRTSLNFFNIGWSNEKRSIFLRIDPYTGEHRELEGPPDKSFFSRRPEKSFFSRRPQ